MNHGERNYLVLDKLPKGQDFFKICQDFLSSLSNNGYLDEERQSSMQVTQLQVDEKNRRIYGLVQSGSYGTTSEMIDITTQRSVYRRRPEDAEIMPFFFMLSFRKGANEVIFLIEKVGNYGVKDNLIGFFKKYVAEQKLTLHCKQFIMRNVIEQIFERGIVKTMRFIRYNVSTDIFDNTLDNGHQEIYLEKEIILKGKNLPISEKLRCLIHEIPYMGRPPEVRELFALEEEEYDDLKIEVEIGGRQKTIDLNNLFRINSSIDITDEVIIEQGGHPSFESLYNVFIRYEARILELIYQSI
ncbi:hypothetical protein V0288_18260 [Pannus brasiliensis CCIBt3594]|uniref:Uncharacterized protein n=1 Tax=Pannus brasiliensis CCIBt3594 TaxID=1427578 RepID=A0AAW9QUT8_9CHRO